MSKQYSSRLGILYKEEQEKRASVAHRECLNISGRVEFEISSRESLPFDVLVTQHNANELGKEKNLKILKDLLKDDFGIIIENQLYYKGVLTYVKVIDFV